jgi:hypothetical protein
MADAPRNGSATDPSTDPTAASPARFVGMLGVAFGYLLLLTAVFGLLSHAYLPGPPLASGGAEAWRQSIDRLAARLTAVDTLVVPLVAIVPLLLLKVNAIPITRARLLGWALVTGSAATLVSAVFTVVGLTVAFGSRMDLVLPTAMMIAVFGFYYLFTVVAVLLADLTLRATVPSTPSRDPQRAGIARGGAPGRPGTRGPSVD